MNVLRRRLNPTAGIVGLTVTVTLLIAGCTSSDQDSDAASGQNPPPPEKGAELMVLDPANPGAGSRFLVTFDEDNLRGGYFYLHRWDGEAWSEPIYLLQSDAGNRVATVTRMAEGVGVDDYGIEGPGPDGLRAPDDLDDGYWRLCTANALDEACAQFTVGDTSEPTGGAVTTEIESAASGVNQPLVVAADGDDQGATVAADESTSDSSTAPSTTASTTATPSTATGQDSTSSTASTAAGAASSTASTARSTTTASTTRGSVAPTACGPGTTACVGRGQTYETLAAAVAAATNGAVIELLPGRYNETVAVTADDVTIRSRPNDRATVDCSGLRPARGKACILAAGTNLTVEHLVVTGARGPDDNEACFRNEPGTRFVVRGAECHGSNNGVLGSGGSWLIEDSHFHGNGAGDGQSHNLYFSGDCSEVVFRRSRSEASVGGHAFKSRCRTSTIESSTLIDNTVADAAEFSNGGTATIRNSTVRQPDGDNGNIIRHGAEGCTHGGQLRITGSTIESGRSTSYIRSSCGPIVIDDTSLPPGVVVEP